MIASDRVGSAMFFYEMISRWLLPLQQLHVLAYYAFDMVVEKKGAIVASITIQAATESELSSIEMRLPILFEELRLGLQSSYHAKRILEIKGLSISDKMGFVLDHLRKVIRRFPERYDYDLIPLMQRFFIHMSDEYRNDRSVLVLEKRILNMYGISRRIQRQSRVERYIDLRVRKDAVMHLFGEKRVLCLTVGINFIKDTERCTRKHLEQAISEVVPEAHLVPESYYEEVNPEGKSRVFSLELEFEKEPPPGCVKRVLTLFPGAIQAHIEQLAKPLVMPRNDEEVMKHMILLSGQLTSPKDIPQMILSFSEQTEQELVFTVILARVLKEGMLSMAQLLEKVEGMRLEKVRVRGVVWKKYPKELSVIRVSVPMFFEDQFGKVHFMKARNRVQKKIEALVGPVRDFFGGMYEKDQKQLEQLILELQNVGSSFDVERFYQGIFPSEYRSVFPNSLLADLYRLFVKVQRDGGERLVENEGNGLLFMKRFEKKSDAMQLLQEMKREGGYRLFFLKEEYGQVFVGGVNFVRNTFAK